jgi:S-adenosylmethionine:tRNA ribosyltransferase-isomerase
MDIELFDFDLPKERIALRPASPRDAARMMVVGQGGGAPDDKSVADLPGYLKSGDVVVFNDTRVIPARLRGKRGDVNIEITLHKQLDEYVWVAFARPAKRLKADDEIDFGAVKAKVLARDGGEVTLKFSVGHGLIKFLEVSGEMPLPPYIGGKRGADENDLSDYQTTYAAVDGAVAAPTAGLHFTDDLMAAVTATGAEVTFLTLHVGAGTFLPVRAQDTADHKMHAEWGEIPQKVADRINRCKAAGGRIIAVGTTSLRLLESAADGEGIIKPFNGDTDIFIQPGYQFKAVDVLMTNFHLPKSTLFMLVSAFSGLDKMRAAYVHAIFNKYRFYSYGDACLLFPEKHHDAV